MNASAASRRQWVGRRIPGVGMGRNDPLQNLLLQPNRIGAGRGVWQGVVVLLSARVDRAKAKLGGSLLRGPYRRGDRPAQGLGILRFVHSVARKLFGECLEVLDSQ